ncbi:hypothetical protein Hanom_Chr08g00703541 [Helianthus anomalus]
MQEIIMISANSNESINVQHTRKNAELGKGLVDLYLQKLHIQHSQGFIQEGLPNYRWHLSQKFEHGNLPIIITYGNSSSL